MTWTKEDDDARRAAAKWDAWVESVESLLGFGVVDSVEEDEGTSAESARAAFDADQTPSEYAARVAAIRRTICKV